MEAAINFYKADVQLKSKKLLNDELVVDEIKKIVIENTGITINQLHDKTRVRKIAKARQLFQYLAYKYTSYSLSYVGSLLGTNYDHTTILNSIYIINDILFLKDRDRYYTTVKSAIEQLELKTNKRKREKQDRNNYTKYDI
ncbi:MAG: helix-turn-helix domain-containing protein [Flavobacterium sp.]|uniref:helix-turn-helix domain-containing protein n=1 Tax=Flavobacterium sp. TaxID=239 RepID=UPI003BCB0D11